MKIPHKICPICNNELFPQKFINQLIAPKGIKVEGKLSFITGSCNNFGEASGKDYSAHNFKQMTTLYGDLLFEEISFLSSNYDICINYVKCQTTIYYFPVHKDLTWSQFGIDRSYSQKLILNRIITLDYPKLENVQQKINDLALYI